MFPRTVAANRGQVFDFFPKPFKIKDFIASINRALGRTGQPQ